MKVYHYSNVKFDKFDSEKSDGFWFTSISPDQEEMLEEIGAAGYKYVAIVEIEINDPIFNGKNSDVAEQLEENEADGIINKYDGFTDYAVVNNDQIKIIEWLNA